MNNIPRAKVGNTELQWFKRTEFNLARKAGWKASKWGDTEILENNRKLFERTIEPKSKCRAAGGAAE